MMIVDFAGCGHGFYWYNADRTIKETKQDCRKCHYEAQREMIDAALYLNWHYGEPFRFSSLYYRTQFKICMKDEGYRYVSENELSSTVRKRAYDFVDEWHYIAGKR